MSKTYSYDLIPYESHSYPQTHPDRLSTLGCLFGLNPAPVTRCRILELACAAGGNLIPMAYHLPESRFVGLDLSARAVETGRKTIDDLQLGNIDIQHGNVMDVDASLGRFDYIIAHGIYSWVPDEVQEKILSIAANHLTDQGIAYISYNTYPGWHVREMIRHMMLYHTRQFADTGDRIEQARALMDFLATSVPTRGNYFGMLLKTELELIQRSEDWYLFHDHLEENNAPVYFHQFMEAAEKMGLQYLGEAEFSAMLATGFPKKVEATLHEISGDMVDAEQYMDFLRNRTFRQTLLCRKGLTIGRHLAAGNLDGIGIASSADPEGGSLSFAAGVKHTFKTANGAWTRTDFPLTKAALVVLREHWPRSMSLAALVDASINLLKETLDGWEVDPAQGRELLAEDLLHCFAGNVIELHTWQAGYVMDISEKPKVSPLAAYQADKGLPIVNQRHETIRFDPFSRELIKAADGSRNREAIVEQLMTKAVDGTFILEQDSKKLLGLPEIQQTLETTMDDLLRKLSRWALLVA